MWELFKILWNAWIICGAIASVASVALLAWLQLQGRVER